MCGCQVAQHGLPAPYMCGRMQQAHGGACNMLQQGSPVLWFDVTLPSLMACHDMCMRF